eukprot:s1047_g7.t1
MFSFVEAAHREVGRDEGVSVISQEPERIQLQRSAFTKLLRALGRGKRKMWQEAIFLLKQCRQFLVYEDTLMQLACRYNTVLDTCRLGKQWHQALMLLNDMLVYGPFPDLVSFNTAIGTYGFEIGLWARALHLLAALPAAGLAPNDRTLSITASACTGANQISKACDLVDSMARQNVFVNKVVRNVLVQAFQVQSQWQQCIEQIDLLRSGAGGLIRTEEPDAKLLTTVAVACGRSREWRQDGGWAILVH